MFAHASVVKIRRTASEMGRDIELIALVPTADRFVVVQFRPMAGASYLSAAVGGAYRALEEIGATDFELRVARY